MGNSVNLIGRLGGDPEVRSTDSGKKVANFSLATDDGWGTNKKTSWHKIVCWGDQCGPIETYLKKGSLVGLHGRIEYRSYDKDGQKVYVTEIIADRVEFLNTKSEAASDDDGF
jgi:single-strand DNA-binding protein